MKTINDLNFKDRKVLLRVDFNVPVDANKNITDDTRMRESLPTINKLLNDGASVIIMAHFGRPKKGGFEPDFSLAPVARHLEKLLNKPIVFTQDLLGEKVMESARNLKGGEVMLLENIRFYPEETAGDAAFAEKLSQLGNTYVNDAFGAAHREHVSTAVIARFFPNSKYFGLLMEHEVVNLQRLLEKPEHPFTAVIGGSKISSKIDILKNLIPVADNILIGGGMSYTFTKAQGGQIGNSICEDDKLDVARELMQAMKDNNTNLYLPVENVIADDFSENANTRIVQRGHIPEGWEGVDISPSTVEIFGTIIRSSKMVLWNGPMGVFEINKFRKGTDAIAQELAKATKEGCFSAVGGGDSVAAINQAGLSKDMSYISTGGGAMLEYLEGKVLPGIKAILD